MVAPSRQSGAAGACHCGPQRPRAGGRFPLLPAVALVLLPKCPLCLGAWLGLLGAGAGSWLQAAWGTPLWLALMTLPVGALLARARFRRDRWLLLAGLAGAAALLAGKCWTNLQLLAAGFILLAGASVWSTAAPAHGLPKEDS